MIAIYEPLYSAGQELQESAFLPLRIENTHPGWHEFRVLVDMYRAGLHRKQALTGLFSPKFKMKTGITSPQFMTFIEANAGADVYMINPRPDLAFLTYNVWMHGAWQHPGILGQAQALLDACDVGWNLADTPRQGPDAMCFSNFWVGTENFWEGYVGGILNRIAEYLERHPESEVAGAVMTHTRYYEPKPLLPFIIERLFSTYLSLARPSTRPYLLDPLASCMNEFDRDIVRFLLGRVRQADTDGVFPPELKQWMWQLHRLRRRFTLAHFAANPHPRDGKVMTPEAIAADMRQLAAEPDIEPLR